MRDNSLVHCYYIFSLITELNREEREILIPLHRIRIPGNKTLLVKEMVTENENNARIFNEQ